MYSYKVEINRFGHYESMAISRATEVGHLRWNLALSCKYSAG